MKNSPWTTGASRTGVFSITGGDINLDAGSVSDPSLTLGGDSSGWYRSAANTWSWATSSVPNLTVGVNTLRAGNGHVWGWAGSNDSTAAFDTTISRAAANSVIFGANGGTNTSRTEINKAIAAFTNAVAKATVTITIPNAAHSASVLFRVTGSIGAGGAIGANEASATNCYVITLTRTAGVNATAAISAAFGAAATAVAGATTVTATAAMSAVSGAVGATNTFTVDVTITRGGGTSDNHTAVVTASLLNANTTGITIS